jgi:hypothetical protein
VFEVDLTWYAILAGRIPIAFAQMLENNEPHMKPLFLIIACSLLLASSCRKHKTATSPVDQLPAETQTGANTFGCLVNGVAFKPGGAQLSGGSLQCNYQFVSGGYYFVLIARNKTGSNLLSSVGLYTDSLKISEGTKLNLKSRIDGNPSGDYFKALSSNQYELFETDGSSYTGELWIKKLDTINQIVSGTFWFNAVNSNKEPVKVTDGRFDVHYTK